MQDGYYDYTTGIPSDYRTDLRTFTRDGSGLIPSGGATYVKTLVFQVIGLDTNVTSAAVQYMVKFSAVFAGAGTGGSFPGVAGSFLA